jgi:hypothetical protein
VDSIPTLQPYELDFGDADLDAKLKGTSQCSKPPDRYSSCDLPFASEKLFEPNPFRRCLRCTVLDVIQDSDQVYCYLTTTRHYMRNGTFTAVFSGCCRSDPPLIRFPPKPQTRPPSRHPLLAEDGNSRGWQRTARAAR